MERNYKPFSDDEVLMNFIKEKNSSAFNAALEDLNNPNAIEGDKSALMIVTLTWYKEVAEKLINKGADIKYKDSTGLNSLMAASYLGRAELLEDLADETTLNSCDNIGQTPLMFACNAGKLECVKLLVGMHAEINARDKQGSTAIMFAAQHGYDPIVKLLLEKGADKNLKESHGFRAIDFARQNKHTSTAKMLSDVL